MVSAVGVRVPSPAPAVFLRGSISVPQISLGVIMKILNKTSDGLKRNYTVLVSLEEVENAFVEKLKERASKTRMHGFRPGKVPVDVIRRMYGDSMRSEAVQNLISSTSKKIINDEKLAVSFDFSTGIIKDDSKGVEFSLKFEVVPTVSIKDISSLTLTKHIAEVTEKEINSIFDEIRKNHKNWVEEPAKAKAKDGNKVSVDLLAKMKLKNNKDGIANNLDIVIGDRNVMEDFWKPLIDKKVGDVVEFVVNYPKGLKDKNLAGKKIEYSATIKKISRSAEYELNDEFAKSLGYEDVKKLHAWAEARAKAHYEQLSKSVMKRDLLEKMSEMYTFEVPDNMFNVEYKEVHRQLTAEANKLGKKMSERAEEECKKIAESRVRLGFVVAEVSRENKITVSKEEIAAEIRNIAAMYPGHEKAIWDMYSRGAALNAIIGPVLERKVVDYLFGIIKIKEKKCSAKELVDLDEETFDFFKESAESSNEKPKKTVEKAEKTEKGEKKEIKKSEKKESTTEKKVKAESKTEKKAAVKKKATKSK